MTQRERGTSECVYESDVLIGLCARYLDGVHDDSEAGHGELVGVPQVVVVQVTEDRRKKTTILINCPAR